MVPVKELVEILAKALVDNSDQVLVVQTETEKSVHLQLTVAPEDMGKVIGKQGKIANAIRTLVKAAAVKDGRRVHMDIDQ
ncbi:MAG: putative RNA-binding protein (contains domain) [Firmicutes bacterium]|nr:putative RNA-binding protein (contains domain) [Bacillota bacterium]